MEVDGEHIFAERWSTASPSANLDNVVHVLAMWLEELSNSNSMSVRMLSHNFLLDRIVTVECQSNQSLVTSVSSAVGRGRNLRGVLSSERSECLSQKLLLLSV
jgi:hypothetical protein